MTTTKTCDFCKRMITGEFVSYRVLEDNIEVGDLCQECWNKIKKGE